MLPVALLKGVCYSEDMSRSIHTTSDLLLDISILYRSTQKYYDQMLQSMSLTYAQLPILILIYENEGISQQQIAQDGGYDKGTITKQVQKLEETGWIRVQPSRKDKRAKELYTTSKARESMSKIYAIRTSWWRHISSSIPKEDMEAFSCFYKNMARSAREYARADLNAISFFEHQKISFLSVPGKVSTIVSTGGCNFRCPFCNQSHLVFLKEDSENYTQEAILQDLDRRKELLDMVTVTGGEPLMHPQLDDFLQKVKDRGYQVHLVTNGSYAEHLQYLLNQKLVDLVEMHIKGTKEKYGEAIGLESYDIQQIEASVKMLQKKTNVIFAMTPVHEFHTPQNLLEIAKWLAPAQKLVLYRFEEKETVIQKGLHGYSLPELETMVPQLKKYIPHIVIR